MPMRFADLDGTMIDVYQAATQMTDESGQSYPFTINTLLDRALGPLGYYGAFTANMHTDSAASGGSDAIVASAQARGVPIVSGRQMLEWLDGRNASSFGSLGWDGDTLTFSIVVGGGANGLRAMVPTTASAGALTDITRNGNAVSFTTETIKGVEYAFFPGLAGNYDAQYGGGGEPADVFVRVSDAGFRRRTTIAQQGDTVQWDFTGGTHSATDASGMGLFDSGLRTAGGSYQFTFTTAARYTVDDAFSANTGTIAVPVRVTPGSGTTSTTFTVTWSSAALSGGFQADIQIRRPGSPWRNWIVNQTTTTSATFTPDAGTGTYQFRARLENFSGRSRWSQPASIGVS
jgi:plastocyanin